MKLNKRHLAKSISWRLIGSIDTFLFTLLITGNLNNGLNVSVITAITKFIWYYLHEHFWVKSSVINSNKRHIIKTFTWRIIGTTDTLIFGWIITGNPIEGLKIGFAESITKLLLYYGHEKLWYKINFGLDKRIIAKRFKRFSK